VLRACVGSNIIERDFFYDKNFERKTNVLTCVNLIATKKWTPSPPPCAPITAASKLKKTSFCHQKKEKNFLNQNFLQTVAWFWLFPKNFVTKIIQLYGERKKTKHALPTSTQLRPPLFGKKIRPNFRSIQKMPICWRTLFFATEVHCSPTFCAERNFVGVNFFPGPEWGHPLLRNNIDPQFTLILCVFLSHVYYYY